MKIGGFLIIECKTHLTDVSHVFYHIIILNRWIFHSDWNLAVNYYKIGTYQGIVSFRESSYQLFFCLTIVSYIIGISIKRLKYGLILFKVNNFLSSVYGKFKKKYYYIYWYKGDDNLSNEQPELNSIGYL